MTNIIVCVECEEEMEREKSGVVVSELGEDCKPYKLWNADRLKCPNCGTRVITGFADRPMLQRPDEQLVEKSKLAEHKF